jgi:hypothetical protein
MRGKPAIEAADTSVTTTVGRQPGPGRGIRRMSRVPVWCSTMPATRNSAALNRACASTSSQASTTVAAVPSPNMTTMNPSWLTVPKARISLRSCWRSARSPPATIVTRPTVTTRGRQIHTSVNAGPNRPTRYTPAFTIVAECR